MACVSVLQRGPYGGEVCVIESTVCKYDFRKGD